MPQMVRNAELHAKITLKQSVALQILGCRMIRGLTGGVVVLLHGRALGVWWFEDGRYKFASHAYRRAYRVADHVEDVVSQTAALVASHFMLEQQAASMGNR